MATKKQITRADRNIAWIENLKITIGEDAGKQFKLRPWQRKFIQDVYGSTAQRKVRRAILSVARKNGKSELAAAIALLHLIGPEAEANGEIILAANSRDQAGVVFNAVKRMIEAEPRLQRLLDVFPSTKRVVVKRSDTRAAGSYLWAISADAGTKHGLNPSLIIYDELAQAKSRELLDTLTTSQGARANPLFLTISTQNHDPQHPLSQMIDDGLSSEDDTVLCHLYAAPDGCDLLDEAAWQAANPALGDFRSLEEFRSMARRAARMPAEEQSFRLLYLNQRVSLQSTLISRADWQACAGDARYEDREELVLAVDMSAKTDLTALAAVSLGDLSKVQTWFWKPEEYLHEHTKRDRVRYDVFAQQGHLLLSPGRSIDPRNVALKIGELHKCYRIRAITYDRWRIDELIRALEAVDIYAQEGEGDGIAILPFGQGFASMSPAVDALEHEILSGTLVHNDNPLMNFCAMNAIAVADPAGNRKIDKSKTRFRIDGAVALVMAIGDKHANHRKKVEAVNPWEDPEFAL